MHSSVAAQLCSLERRIVVCGNQEVEQLRLIKLDVQLDLTRVVMAGQLFVNEEDLVQEQVHVLFHVRAFFVGRLPATFAQLLHARVYDLERPMLAMSFQDVLDGLIRIYAEHFAKIWIQGEVDGTLVEEVKHSGILLPQNDIEGILILENLLVKFEECIEEVLVMARAFPL